MKTRVPEEAGWFLDEFDADRFWSKVNFRGGYAYRTDPYADRSLGGQCWTRAARDVYGRFRVGPRWLQAHAVAYRDFGKVIPDTMEIDHLCRVPGCVRPDHLEAVPRSVNLLRGKPGGPKRVAA